MGLPSAPRATLLKGPVTTNSNFENAETFLMSHALGRRMFGRKSAWGK
jgi:hypothetical protein